MTYLLWIISITIYCLIGVYFAKSFSKSKHARALTYDDLVDCVIAGSLFWLLVVLAVFCQGVRDGYRKSRNKAANDKTYR